MMDLGRLKTSVPGWLSEHRVPGLALALLRHGHVVADLCFGVRSKGTNEAVTADTFFEAASLTKPMVAAVALQLCDEGRIELDRPVCEVLPDAFLPGDPRADAVTLRHILCHTTGLPNWRKNGEALRTRFDPGERFSYSGEAFAILGRILESVTGEEIRSILQTRLCEPLEMERTAFVWTGTEDLPIAVGHNTKAEAQEKRRWPEVNPAASLHCTARDFARFLGAMMMDHPGFPLRSGTREAMFRPQISVNSLPPWHEDWPDGEMVLEDHVAWGLGWGLQTSPGRQAIWHWGDNGAYRGFAFGVPATGDGLVILTNGESGQWVIRRILEAAAGPDLPALDWLDTAYGLR